MGFDALVWVAKLHLSRVFDRRIPRIPQIPFLAGEKLFSEEEPKGIDHFQVPDLNFHIQLD